MAKVYATKCDVTGKSYDSEAAGATELIVVQANGDGTTTRERIDLSPAAAKDILATLPNGTEVKRGRPRGSTNAANGDSDSE